MPSLVTCTRLPMRILSAVLSRTQRFRFVSETRDTQTPATLEAWLLQNLVGVNNGPYWPVHPSSRVAHWQQVLIGIETSPGLMPGCYIQGIGGIEIGDYTQIAPNVGIISANHDLCDNRTHIPEKVTVGSYAWIGMGAVILPGVHLGDFTIVGANAVVTKSFEEGHCVVAGNPARLIRKLPVESCTRHRSRNEYNGFIPHAEFAEFRRRFLRL